MAFEESQEIAVGLREPGTERREKALETIIGEGFEFVHSTGRIEDRSSFIARAAAGQLAMQRIPAETRLIASTSSATPRSAPNARPSE